MIGSLGNLQRRFAGLWKSYPDRWATALFRAWLGLALLSAVPVYLVTDYFTENAKRSEFAIAAEEAAHRLAREVDVTLAHLRAVKGLYHGSVHVSRDEFSAFVQALRPSEAVQALEWVPRVPASERAEWEDAAQKEGFPDFQFREYNAEGVAVTASERPEYFPVYYFEPFTGNEAVFGFDFGSNQARLDIMRRARDSGNQTASGRVRLVQEQEDQYGILVFDPFYAEASVNLDVRIERLEGFALGVFRVGDLVRLAIPEDQFQVAVFDHSAPPGERQIHPVTEMVEADLGHHTVMVKIADRQWSVRLTPTVMSPFSTLPWLATATWLGALLVLSRELVSSRRHSEQLATVNDRLQALSQQRQQAIKELERSNRELDDFAYITSHDLKEPLRAVFQHATFLLEDYEQKLDPSGKKRLNRLIVLSQRMQMLISDLLYFSRLGRGELAVETVDLNEVIADIEISLAEALQRQNATISIMEPLPRVQGHRPHMKALFQNLICNGINYNDSKERTIEIGYSPTGNADSGEGMGRFHVRDNGIGIDEQFKDDVFRIFRRLNSEQAYGEGTGAGLSFVKKIVENHGGAIWLTSIIGEGTTFFFTLKAKGQIITQDINLQAA